MSSFDFDYWHIKILYDLTGYLSAFWVTWFFYTKVFRRDELPNPFSSKNEKIEYMLSVIAGAMLWGILISTFDGFMISGRNPENGILISKSIAGALFWWVITAEIYKYFHKIKIPTGILFLPGIIIWICIGRIGAIITWLRDFTYGTPTMLPWGIDFGDNIKRHPTMIHEMIILILFFLIFCIGLSGKERKWWINNGFYLFVIIYFLYRFFVGFIQPYSTWWFWLSTYQFISIPMIVYGIFMLTKKS